MSSQRRPRGESASVAPIEELLRAVSSDADAGSTRRDGRVVTTHAVWFCACETFDEWEMWVVHATGEDGIGWLRVPDDASVADVVEAEHLAGHHPAPEGLLKWLGGDDPDPWRSQSGDPEGAAVLEEIHRRIRRARA